MRSIVVAALLAASAATPALAQDTSGRAPFTGPRVEGIVGWDRVSNNGRDDAVTYGLGAGYDFQAGKAVIGLEAEASDSSAKACIGSATAIDPRLCAHAGRDLYVGGRIGTVVGERALLYVKGGYTNARAKGSLDDGTTILRGSENFDGFRVGAGAEYAVGPNAFVKAEYRYSNYEQGFSRNQIVAGFGFRF